MDSLVHTHCCGARLVHSRGKYVVCPLCKKIARFPSGILRSKLFELAKAIVGTELSLDDMVFGDSTIWHLDPDKIEKDLECCRIIRGHVWTFNEFAQSCLTLRELQEAGRIGAFKVQDSSGLEIIRYA